MTRILIVEDDGNIAKMIAASLSIVGYESQICPDGRMAVETILSGRFDLILLDVMLPGLSGFQVLEEIRCREIPVIFLTAKQDVADKVRGLRLGAEDYMVKPFEMMELFARVENVLKRRKKLKDFMEIDKCRIDLSSHKVYEEGRRSP